PIFASMVNMARSARGSPASAPGCRTSMIPLIRSPYFFRPTCNGAVADYRRLARALATNGEPAPAPSPCWRESWPLCFPANSRQEFTSRWSERYGARDRPPRGDGLASASHAPLWRTPRTANMCGVAGIWRHDGDAATATELAPMLAAIAHRGPDDNGT